MRPAQWAVSLLLAGVLIAGQTGAPGGKRKRITIDHTRVAAALDNFPVLFAATDPDLKSVEHGGNVAENDGSDLLFTAEDGTRLPHELAFYDGQTGEIAAWIKVPRLSATADTVLYVYFGNGSVRGRTSRGAVWDSTYRGVYHFMDAGLNDSSSFRTELRGPALGRPAQARRGLQAALELAAATDFAMRPADDAQTGPVTLSLWVRRLGDYAQPGSIGYITRSNSGGGDLVFCSTPAANSMALRYGGRLYTIAEKVNTAWNQVVVARTGGLIRVYFNGRLVRLVTIDAGTAMGLGGLGDIGGSASFEGEVKEVRWSEAERPAEWLATEYSNQSAPWAFAAAGSVEPAPLAQTAAPTLIFQQPDAVAATALGTEAIDKRTRNARHFRNPDGSWTAVLANNLNAPDATGKLVPVLRQLWQTPGGGWEMDAGSLTVTLAKSTAGYDLQHAYAASDGANHVLTISFPALAWSKETSFGFSAAGQNWNLGLDKDTTSFTTLVSASRGAQTYTFPFSAQGMKLSVNAQGNLVLEDGTSLSRALMQRADGHSAQCSPWSIDGNTLSFTCDDSQYPKTAFPYLIDPTLTPSVANLQSCRYRIGCWLNCLISCTQGSYLSEYDDDAGYFTATATWTMDTSSIPANATINSVSASMTASYGMSMNSTYTVKGANNAVVGNCVGLGIYGSNPCNNLAAPSNSIVPGGTTTFSGTCNFCGVPSNPPGYGWGSLSSFSLTVTYSPAPASITINTSPAGRTFTVDGTNYSSAQTFTWAYGTQHTIAINTQTQAGGTGTQYVWTSWSDAGAASHTISTPATNTTYTANFKTQYYLTTAEAGVGGTITPSSGWYDSGTQVPVRG
jgi:hypothetical protein